MDCANEAAVTITSTFRTPSEQAKIMYDNIISDGITSAYNLYSSCGDKVVDVYVSEKRKGYSASQIIADMKAKIDELGPQNVTHHCSNSTDSAYVFDVGRRSVSNESQFMDCVIARLGDDVDIFFYPPKDKAFHLEINQY